MKQFLTILITFVVLPAMAQQNVYQLNQKNSYTLNFTQQASIDVGTSSPNKVGRSISFDLDIFGEKVSGNLEGQVQLTNIMAEQALPNGKQKVDTRNLNKPLDFSVPLNGGAIKVTGKLPGVALGQAYGGVISLDYLLSYQFMELPAQAMKIGVEWKSSLSRTQLESTGQMTPTLHFTHKVVGKEKINGRQCFKIETNMTSSIQTEVKLMQHETPFEYDGGSTAEVVWFYDAKNKRISKLTANEKSKGSMGMATITQETTFELVLKR